VQVPCHQRPGFMTDDCLRGDEDGRMGATRNLATAAASDPSTHGRRRDSYTVSSDGTASSAADSIPQRS